ncbi:MAG: glycosyl hydrolase [Gemmatimonadaceae bacterium]
MGRYFLLVLSLVPASVLAQARPTAAPVFDTTRYERTAPELRGMRWRLVGPFRGGRSVAVTGDPSNPRLFYFGAVDGGVWKSTNAGQSWTNMTDGKSSLASVGAIAVAPGDPNVVYAGGGEADFREDYTYGDGIERSTDGGRSWARLGLEDARHIARIVVDPRDADIAYVAAMGHGAGPNPTRGVFRTRDGGKTWQKVLFIDDSTGAIDLALDPRNARVLYAAMWRMQRLPWGFNAGAGRSGLWKSTDAGDHWTELTFNEGMPHSRIGRIGVTVSPVDPERLYATIETPPEDSTGGIFRSDDGGKSWERTSGDQRWMVRPWYYSVVRADPTDANTMYVMNLSTWKSIDGGHTFTRFRLPHGDTHDLWIDPKDSKRLISGNDGGATVSIDGGESWSSVMNQPTAQFYHVTTDDQFPYRIYGAQQDNTTVSIASRSDNGVITREDWYDVGGGESGYIAPKPNDPNTIIAGAYTGTLTRYDIRAQHAKDISVGLNNYDGWPSAQVPNRFQWTFPLFYSRHRPNELFVAANRVFRSTNDGDSWEAMSPDLTLHDPVSMGPVGGAVTHDMTGTEWYATIFAVAESPATQGVFWAGSDDGLVHVTRDDMKTWTNVTPRDMAHFTRVSIIEPSHFDAGTAYIAANRYQLDDLRPYLWKTTDYGRSWTRIDGGIPAGSYTRVIREDPVRRGLLYVGTENGVWYSTDDGSHWRSLQLNLPRAAVRDLHVHGSDVIAATHGRAFWVLDDVSPLRQMTDAIRTAAVHLFTPDTAIRFGGGSRRADDAGENPPCCLTVSYCLRQRATTPVTLEFRDGAGKIIRSFTSATDTAKKVDSTAKTVQPRDTLSEKQRGSRPLADDTLSFIPADSIVPARAGLNRFVWNLRYPATHEVRGVINDEGSTSGPVVAPGRYAVRLAIGGNSQEQTVVVRQDPRFRASQADYDAQVALALQVQQTTNELSDAVGRILDLEHQIDERVDHSKSQSYASRISGAAAPLRQQLEAVRDSLVEIHSHADQITLHYPIRLYNMLLSLADMVQSAEGAPTKQESEVYRDISTQVDRQLARLRNLESTDILAFNRMMKELDVPAIVSGVGPKADRE